MTSWHRPHWEGSSCGGNGREKRQTWEADVGSSVLGRWRFPGMASPAPTSASSRLPRRPRAERAGITGFEVCAPESYVEVPTSGTCEYDLIWREGLCGCNEIEVKLN